MCICMCIHVCVHVCMYARVCICMCVRACVYVCSRVYVCMCAYACVYVCYFLLRTHKTSDFSEKQALVSWSSLRSSMLPTAARGPSPELNTCPLSLRSCHPGMTQNPLEQLPPLRGTGGASPISIPVDVFPASPLPDESLSRGYCFIDKE